MMHRFIISLGSVGTIAAFNMISRNGDILLPPYPETSDWLRNYDAFFAMAAGRLMLQTHSVNDLDSLEKIFLEKEDTACLTLIREPHAGITSWINASIFHEVVRRNLVLSDMDAFIEQLIGMAPYHHLIRSSRIADKAEKQLILDMSAFETARLDATQARISEFFGIRNGYASILDKENSYFSRFLYDRGLSVELLNLKMEIKFSGYGNIVDNQHMTHLFDFPSPSLWSDFMPQGRQIVVYLQLTSDFNNYAVPMRQYDFVVGKAKEWMTKHLHRECERLCDEFKRCMNRYERIKISSLDDLPGAGVRQLASEVSAFYRERYPDIAYMWDTAGTAQ